MTTRPQSYANHARVIPGYHFVAFGLVFVSCLWTGWRTATDFSLDRLMLLALNVAVVLLLFYARVFALTAQDRVIRLEMRQRLALVLPPDLRSRIGELSPRQLVGLRFASDAELPDLVRTVLTDRITDVRAIKRMVRDWQADHLRV